MDITGKLNLMGNGKKKTDNDQSKKSVINHETNNTSGADPNTNNDRRDSINPAILLLTFLAMHLV